MAERSHQIETERTDRPSETSSEHIRVLPIVGNVEDVPRRCDIDIPFRKSSKAERACYIMLRCGTAKRNLYGGSEDLQTRSVKVSLVKDAEAVILNGADELVAGKRESNWATGDNCVWVNKEIKGKLRFSSTRKEDNGC